ncbi:hypothetical protein ABNX05_11415 [Lysinibacillus sp. M3]|uniref:Uncharacterized protein n=1 Tax=Lysinibacillus zambalensis TaxID=3160866 RepID=A0ABV1MRU4_9BACI
MKLDHKQSALNFMKVINSNVEYAIKATENSYHSKFFIVVNGDRIENFSKTKRGAEGYIKKYSFSYYDEYFQEMREAGANLEIVELSSFDIIDYYNNAIIWFDTMITRWRIRQGNIYMLTLAKNLECSDNVIKVIESILENSDGNSFPSLSMVGLEEIEENEVVETDTPEASTETIEETNNSITMKLNDEKNGVELYFTDKPSEEIRTQLKSSSFRWSRFNKCWFAKQNGDTLALAELLSSGNIEVTEVSEPFEIEPVEFVDITQFKINEETEKRLIDNSLFNNGKEVGRETKQLQLTLTNLLENTKEVIELADNIYSKNTLINGFNAFCERYTRELNSYLYQRSVNPGWAVTGRGGLNINRYNKKQDQLHNKMGKVVEMLEKQKSILEKYESRIIRNNANKEKQDIDNAIANIDECTIVFTTKKRAVSLRSGFTNDVRCYISANYYIAKIGGCYRVFDNVTNKEICDFKTTDKLDYVKKYVMYLESQRVKQAI